MNIQTASLADLGHFIASRTADTNAAANKMTTQITDFQIIEDNGGGLHAFLFDANDNIVRGVTNLEYLSHDDFMINYNALKSGDDASDWDGLIENPAVNYEAITSHEYGYKIVASKSKIYPNRMGAAASIAFGITDGG